jgi:hypothetical protein
MKYILLWPIIVLLLFIAMRVNQMFEILETIL